MELPPTAVAADLPISVTPDQEVIGKGVGCDISEHEGAPSYLHRCRRSD